jgi:hypothetical protein
MSRSNRQSSRSNTGAITGGIQALFSKEASSSTGLQANVLRSGTTSGVVTRSSSKRQLQSPTPQEDSSQSKGKKKIRNNPPPLLGKLFWIFYSEQSETAQSFLVTEDMLDKELSDMRPLFALTIRESYNVNINERTIQFRAVRTSIVFHHSNSRQLLIAKTTYQARRCQFRLDGEPA